MTTTIQHLAAAWKCVAELEQLGCRVLSVCAYPHEDAARIHIADPGSLLDHIDAMSVDTSMVEYTRMGVRVAGCDVFWLLHRPQVEIDLEHLRETLS